MTVVDLYTIQIVRVRPSNFDLDAELMAELMAETEENVTDLLPPGFKANVKKWDHPDPDEGNDDG